MGIGDRIEAYYRKDKKWYPATYKGEDDKDEEGREYYKVTYDIMPNLDFHKSTGKIRRPTVTTHGFGALTIPGEESGSLFSETRRRLTSAALLRDTSHRRRLPVMEGLLAEIAEAQARA